MIVYILITNNKEAYLEKAISSCINQDFDDFEVLLIDDISTDNSIQVIEKFNDIKNLRYFINSNQGIISSKNEGKMFCK